MRNVVAQSVFDDGANCVGFVAERRRIRTFRYPSDLPRRVAVT